MIDLHHLLRGMGLGDKEAIAYLTFISILLLILFGKVLFRFIVTLLALFLTLLSFLAGVAAQCLIILSSSTLLRRKPSETKTVKRSVINGKRPQKH